MKVMTKKPKKKRSQVTPALRDAAFLKYGHRCYYPDCRLEISIENYLVIHDITDTGQHTKLSLVRPLCMTHHNRATADARRAKSRLQKFQAQGIKIGSTQGFLFEQEFYGGNKGN